PQTYEIALELERVAAGIYGPKGIYPNVDFYSGVVYSAIGIPTDVFTPIFAIARVAGWLAHWHEQLVGNRIFRPEQIHVGKTDVPYVPLEKPPEPMARLETALADIRFARSYTLRSLDALPASDGFRMPPGVVTHVGWQVGHLAMAQDRLALLRVRGPAPVDGDLIGEPFIKTFGAGSVPDPDPAKY